MLRYSGSLRYHPIFPDTHPATAEQLYRYILETRVSNLIKARGFDTLVESNFPRPNFNECY